MSLKATLTQKTDLGQTALPTQAASNDPDIRLPPEIWDRIQRCSDPKTFVALTGVNKTFRALPTVSELQRRFKAIGYEGGCPQFKDKDDLLNQYVQHLHTTEVIAARVRRDEGWVLDFGPTDFVQFSPDGQYLLAGEGYNEPGLTIRWNLRTGDVVRGHVPMMLPGIAPDASTISFSPDGQLLAAAVAPWGSFGFGKPQVWVYSAQKTPLVLLHKLSFVQSDIMRGVPVVMSFSGNSGLLAAHAGNNELRVWNLRQTPPAASDFVAENVTSLTFSPNGRYLATERDNLVDVLDLEQPHAAPLSLRHEFPMGRISYSSDGRFLVSHGSFGRGRLHGRTVWDLRQEQPARVAFGNIFIRQLWFAAGGTSCFTTHWDPTGRFRFGICKGRRPLFSAALRRRVLPFLRLDSWQQ